MKKVKIRVSSEKATIVSNYGYLLFLQGANYLLPLILLPFLVRVLGTEKYGLVMFAQSTAIILSVIVDFGFKFTHSTKILRNSSFTGRDGFIIDSSRGVKFRSYRMVPIIL